ncbi:hypothetical protein V6N12_015301 [Hibiscus sabdariffa]|uniref:Reverse transcriptase zinc-binding domain-containing protein n=1 Tax=Hibiscus sabdariffa TaxID=183260 RepID=A0ABR2DMR8_9ROSI
MPVKVAEMVDANGCWDWRRMDRWMPQETMEKLAAIKPPRSGAGSDILGWRWEKNRDFSVRSAYKVLQTAANTESNIHWSKIWKLPVPQRTIEHALRSYPTARRVWEALVRPEKHPIFFSLPFTEWLRQCVSNAASIEWGDDLWDMHFSVFCWIIWKQRCAAVFGKNTSQRFAWIQYRNQLIESISNAYSSSSGMRPDNSDIDNRCLAAWHPPAIGWVFHVQRCKNVIADKLASLSRDKH